MTTKCMRKEEGERERRGILKPFPPLSGADIRRRRRKIDQRESRPGPRGVGERERKVEWHYKEEKKKKKKGEREREEIGKKGLEERIGMCM